MDITIFPGIYTYGALTAASSATQAIVTLTRRLPPRPVRSCSRASSTQHSSTPLSRTRSGPTASVAGRSMGTVSAAPRSCSANRPDAVVVGEGEETVRLVEEGLRCSRDRLPRRRQGSRDAACPPASIGRPLPDPEGIGSQSIRGASAYIGPTGVHRGCTFCQVPRFFATIRSRPLANIIEEVKAFAACGRHGSVSGGTNALRSHDGDGPGSLHALLRGMAG